MIWRDYPSREALITGCAAALEADLRATLAAKGAASLALPGGTTPAPVFAALSQANLNWPEVTVFAGDERAVAADHPRSNTGLIAAHLCQNRAAAARLIPLAPTAAWVADATRALAPHLPPDVALLGMGEDGHIASLFPGREAVQSSDLIVKTTSPQDEVRLSLGARPLRDAAHLHLLITGAAKRAVLTAAADLPPATAPVRLVLDRAIIHWAA